MLDCTILPYLLSLIKKKPTKKISALQGRQNEKFLCEGLRNILIRARICYFFM